MTEPVQAVIVNFNAGSWLGRSVASLLAAEADIALVVFDNASTDDSLQALTPWADDPRLTLVKSESNLGFGRACNQALAGSQAPYLLILNPDCEVESDCVARLVSTLAERPHAGIAGALVLDEDGREQRACRRRRPTPGRATVSMLGLDRLGLEGVDARGPLPREPIEVEAVSGALLLLRRACFEALEGFDTRYFLHCEDLDMFERARQAGWSIWFDPRARAHHAGGVSQRGRRLSSEWHKHTGMIRYFQRHLGPELVLPLRWVWPLVITAHFLVLAPLYWLRSRMGSG